jgi:hypothetical protein
MWKDECDSRNSISSFKKGRYLEGGLPMISGGLKEEDSNTDDEGDLIWT